MKIVIIGAVAGGTSAAAKARRNNENAEIKYLEDIKIIGRKLNSCLSNLLV